MGKLKEEDKIEKIIRGLLKVPENRRCINCNSLGPQYVCSTFWTFVCTNCSGVHREFTHRVKSISMAKFSIEEVNALKAGGNEKARQIYFKTWDPHRNHFPETSNIHRIRDFIKRVYVDRQYTGETLPVVGPRNSGLSGSYEHRRAHTGDNFTFQEKSFDRDSRYSYDEYRSPQYLRDNSKSVGIGANSSGFKVTSGSYQMDDPRENSVHGGLRNNASCHESRGGHIQVVDPRETFGYGDSSRSVGKYGHFHVDNSRVAGWAATQMFTTEDIKPRRGSPVRKQSIDMDNLTIGHVKEILGENSKALRIANNPKFSDRKSVRTATNAQQEGDRYKEGYNGRDHYRTNHRRAYSANTQDIAVSTSKSSYNNAELKPRCGSAGSLLAMEEFRSEPDRLAQEPCPQAQAALKPPVKKNSSNALPKNSLELLLLDFSTPAEKSLSALSGILCDENAKTSSSSSHQSTWYNVTAPSTLEHPLFEVVPVLPCGSEDSSRVAEARSSTDERTSPAASATSSNTLSASMPARLTDADTSKIFAHQKMEDLLGDVVPITEEASRMQSSRTQQLEHSGTSVSDRSSSSIQVSHLIAGADIYPDLGQTAEIKSAVEMRPSPADSKAGGRTELPADLFTSPYQLNSMPLSGWQPIPSYGLGLNMHYYPPQIKVPSFPNVAKSRNPFDTDDNTDQSYNTMFASKEFVQGGLTNMFIPPGTSHTANFGSHLRGPASTGSPAYPSKPPSGANLRHRSIQNWMPTSIQGQSGFAGYLGSTASHSTQQIPYRYAEPTDQNLLPTGRGNPFG